MKAHHRAASLIHHHSLHLNHSHPTPLTIILLSACLGSCRKLAPSAAAAAAESGQTDQHHTCHRLRPVPRARALDGPACLSRVRARARVLACFPLAPRRGLLPPPSLVRALARFRDQTLRIRSVL